MKVELVPFDVPTGVRRRCPPVHRQDGFTHLPVILLADVPAEDLAALCDQFRTTVFRRAEKPDPAGRPAEPSC